MRLYYSWQKNEAPPSSYAAILGIRPWRLFLRVDLHHLRPNNLIQVGLWSWVLAVFWTRRRPIRPDPDHREIVLSITELRRRFARGSRDESAEARRARLAAVEEMIGPYPVPPKPRELTCAELVQSWKRESRAVEASGLVFISARESAKGEPN